MKSCIYRGTITHRRHRSAAHEFRYALFMMYLDLDEIGTLFCNRWFWSARRPAPARFRRGDHLGPADQPLADSVRDLVESSTGDRPNGPIRLLTHLRYFGFCFNPLSIYYCHDEHEHLQAVVLEVSNTPWREMHAYVLADPRPGRGVRQHVFDKSFHVSPFLPMAMQYRCKIAEPSDKLLFSIENWREHSRIFDAHLSLTRIPVTGRSLAATLLTDPLITLRVTALIHWQAMKLWFKRVPFYPHPVRSERHGGTRALPHERTR